MSVKPILFSAPMVRAILDGRKGQTRRLVNVARYATALQGYSSTGRLVNYYGDHRLGLEFASDRFGLWNAETNPSGRSARVIPVPYHPGQMLWVREAWRAEARNDVIAPRVIRPGSLVSYDADYDHEPNDGCRGKTRVSIHMPRWASRLTLEVTSVKVERLQEISEEDAKAEGVEPAISGQDEHGRIKTYRTGFVYLWGSINGTESWLDNPWVVAVSFRAHRQNIDAFLAGYPSREVRE